MIRHSDSIRADSLTLLSPTPNTTYRITSDIDAAAQQLSVEAASGQALSKVTIYVDGKPLQEFTGGPYQTWWQLAEGEHHFWVEGTTATGATVKSEEVTITVLP
jgi:hypothetical protein